MPVTRTIKGRGVNGVLVVAAEPLFAVTGSVGRWTNGVSQRVRIATARAAPTNKRPRWAHYGKPLKQTFTASTAYQPERLRVYAGIGSTAPHALYVDQGTKPFEAKILPPWTRGGSDLREATYKYPVGFTSNSGRGGVTWKPMGGIMVSGQRAQNFFAEGLAAGLAASGVSTVPLPVDGGIEGVIDGIPASLTGASGNTPVNAAFIAQLEEWRAWRNEGWLAYQKGRKRPPRARGRRRTVTQADRRRWWRKASQKYRDKNRDNTKPKRNAAVRAERARFLAAMIKKYGANNVDKGSLEFRKGYWYITIRTKDSEGRTIFKEVRGKSTVN